MPRAADAQTGMAAGGRGGRGERGRGAGDGREAKVRRAASQARPSPPLQAQ
jgi:hypothetical protein